MAGMDLTYLSLDSYTRMKQVSLQGCPYGISP